jgi:hypothetical protein
MARCLHYPRGKVIQPYGLAGILRHCPAAANGYRVLFQRHDNLAW